MKEALSSMLSRSYIARFLLAALVYGATAYVSLYLVPPGGGASLVWPPAAVGFAILWFWGIDLWPAIAVGIFGALLARGISAPLVAVTAVGNLLESVIGVYILRQYVRFSPRLSRLRDSLGLVIASFAAAFVGSVVITLGVFVVNQQAAPSSALLVGLWIGHAVSLLSMAPFLLRWLHRPFFTKTSREIVEGVAVFGVIFTITTLLFWTTTSSIAGISLIYILIIPLIWAALRTGPRGIALAIFILALVGATGTLFGFGPITYSSNLAQTLFGVQMIIGTLSLIFLLFTSITEERKEAINNLQGHVDQLEGALEKISSEDKAKSDFIAILAHELRNPLSPLLSGLELLKVEEKGDPQILGMMGAHLHTIARLLDDLLDISRISQKKFKLQKERIEIGKVVSHTLEMVEPQMQARNHTFVVKLPEEEVWMDGDPVRLSQIFVNLLTNAAKYTDPGGKIELEVAQRNSEVIVRVKDNGIGIAPERLGKVFEPFGTTESGEQRPSGLRIGLSLARRMAEMHHGRVDAHSAGENKGTEFLVRLPLPDTAPLPLEENTKRKNIRGRFSKEAMKERFSKVGALQVLVVDDNEPAAQGLATLLRHNGHLVRLAYDAPEALALCETQVPDVAILDIGLPTMSGYELGRNIRERWGKDVTLVALTGYGQEEDKQKAREAGFEEHLVKPVSIVDVERVLSELRAKA
jgi:signal transduction histidine kinase/CheY-like chemotaxis protein